jgi:hypothetical protein
VVREINSEFELGRLLDGSEGGAATIVIEAIVNLTGIELPPPLNANQKATCTQNFLPADNASDRS